MSRRGKGPRSQRATVYRRSSTSIKATVILALGVLVTGFFKLRDPFAVVVALGIGCVVGGLMLVWSMRLATVADAAGLSVTGFFTTRMLPWSRIQAIIIVTNGWWQPRYYKEWAVAYLDTGRRVRLQGIDSRALAGTNRPLSAVVDSLRRRWLANRGAAWRPIDAVQAKAAELAHYKVSSARVAMQAWSWSLVAAVFIGVGRAVLNAELITTRLVGLLLVGPPAVSILVWIASIAYRRARRNAIRLESSPLSTPGQALSADGQPSP